MLPKTGILKEPGWDMLLLETLLLETLARTSFWEPLHMWTVFFLFLSSCFSCSLMFLELLNVWVVMLEVWLELCRITFFDVMKTVSTFLWVWNLGNLQPSNPASVELWNSGTFALAVNLGNLAHWKPSSRSSTCINLFWDSHSMDPLVYAILEPGNLDVGTRKL